MSQQRNRIGFLDGLRGLAILLVVIYHYASANYAANLPYGDRYAGLPLVSHGWVGVYLFFMISGFVIAMTLEKCRSFLEFIERRWLRLFPAMLIATALIFTFSRCFGALTPHGIPSWLDILPGLSFIRDAFWHALLHTRITNLDGVFWTIYVEVGFYVIAGTLHFRIGPRAAIPGVIAVWLAVLAAPAVLAHLPHSPLTRVIEPLQWLGIADYGWFAAGMLFYQARKAGSRRLHGAAIAVAVAGALTYTTFQAVTPVDRAYLLACVVIFAAALDIGALQMLLSTRAALFLGYVSYPLYLVHNEVGIGLIALLARALPKGAEPLLPLGVGGLMVLVAWVIVSQLEPRVRTLCQAGIRQLRKRPQPAAPAGRVTRDPPVAAPGPVPPRDGVVAKLTSAD